MDTLKKNKGVFEMEPTRRDIDLIKSKELNGWLRELNWLSPRVEVRVENEDYTKVHMLFPRYHDSEIQELLRLSNLDVECWIWRDTCPIHTIIN